MLKVVIILLLIKCVYKVYVSENSNSSFQGQFATRTSDKSQHLSPLCVHHEKSSIFYTFI